MQFSWRRWLNAARGRLRLARRAPAAARTANPVAPGGGSGRWQRLRFRESRRLSFAARARRTEFDYQVYLPAGCSRRDRLPLLLMLHGCHQDAAGFAAGTRMNSVADDNRFVVLYPEQNRGANSYGCWNWFDTSTLEGQGEAAMLAQLTRVAIDRYPIDPERVYLAGMSAGGAMVATLALCHGALYAAAAIHSGLMYGAAQSAAQAGTAMRAGSPQSPLETARAGLRIGGRTHAFVPMLILHGENDRTVHPLNAGQIVAQQLAVAAHAGASAMPAALAERQLQAGGREYRQLDYLDGSRVMLRRILISQLGHAWSGGDAQWEFNDAAGPDASRMIWQFVSRHRRSTRRESTEQPRRYG